MTKSKENTKLFSGEILIFFSFFVFLCFQPVLFDLQAEMLFARIVLAFSIEAEFPVSNTGFEIRQDHQSLHDFVSVLQSLTLNL